MFVSDRFMEEVRRSHTVVAYVEVRSITNEVRRLTATGGSVTVDRTAAIRRACSLTCSDPDGTFTPTDQTSLLAPFGTEIRPYRGVRYSDGTEEYAPLGVFRLSNARVSDSLNGVEISLEASDFSRTITRDKFTDVYTVAAGTNIVAAIKAIVERTIIEPDYDTITSALTTTAPTIFDVGDDPWEAITMLAESIGCEAYFDVLGRFVLAPPADIDSLPAPVFDYIEGQGCTMTELDREFTDDPGFNGVIVIGESAGDESPPVRGEAWDETPTSPTFRYGPYGEVPDIVTDNNVKTTADAQIMARQLLQHHLGFSTQVGIAASVNPAVDAGSIVKVVRARSHVSGLYLVDSLSVPMRGTTHSLTLREKRRTS